MKAPDGYTLIEKRTLGYGPSVQCCKHGNGRSYLFEPPDFSGGVIQFGKEILPTPGKNEGIFIWTGCPLNWEGQKVWVLVHWMPGDGPIEASGSVAGKGFVQFYIKCT